jgi:phosphosulfolactate phosphohydrolase-like enzyme
MPVKGVFLTYDASGAVAGAKMGHVILVVDVISMSTTLEAALEAGAAEIFGASPDISRAPVDLNPEKIGWLAGSKATQLGCELVLIGEPRIGTDAQRMASMTKAVQGIRQTGAIIGGVLPNLGAETVKMMDLRDKVVLAVTDTGGVAFDAAITAGAPAVSVATIARTIQCKGTQPADQGALRGIALAEQFETAITVVAASSNSLEDILGAEYIARRIIELPFSTSKKSK